MENDSANKGSSLKPLTSRPSLDQSRRHSWYGSSQEVSPHNGLIRQSAVYEADSNDVTVSSITSWWNLNGWNRPKTDESPSDSQRTTDCSPTAMNNKTPTIQLSAKKQDSTGEEYVGLMRRRLTKTDSNDKQTDDGKSEAKPVLPKRRSGIGNWMSGASSRLLQDKLISANAEDNRPNENRRKPPFVSIVDAESHGPSPTDSRSMHRRATVHYSSSGRPSLMDTNRRSYRVSLQAKEHKALEQIKDVSRDYIIYRLRQRDLANRVTINRQQSNSRWLFHEMLFISGELERLQKCRFHNISKQVGITLRSEDVLRKLFFELAGEIITTEPKQNGVERQQENFTRRNGHNNLFACGSRLIEITWGRICAVLAVAGGLAVDCVQQGHSDLVNQLIEYCGEFAQEEGVLTWIANQGGWESLRDLTYESSSRTPATDPCYFAKLTNIALAFVACTIGAVLGAVALGNISSNHD